MAVETGANPSTLLRCELPPEDMQQKIAGYVGVSVKNLFAIPRTGVEYLSSRNINPYLYPDINSEPNTDEDMAVLYRSLSPIAKRLVYNLAYDLSVVESENDIKVKKRNYWEK